MRDAGDSGHPELRICRGGYALGPSQAYGAAKAKINVRGTWGAQVLDRLARSPDHDAFMVDSAKIDPFTCSEFESLLRNPGRHRPAGCGANRASSSRPSARRCTSSGPSAKRRARCQEYIRASGKSWEMPPPP
jgi:hypothetical protein